VDNPQAHPRIRLYAPSRQGAEQTNVSVLLDPPPEAQQPTPFRLTDKQTDTTGSAEPGKRTTAEAKVCIQNGHADLALTTDASALTNAAPLGPFRPTAGSSAFT
jgi:hypothetical protein